MYRASVDGFAAKNFHAKCDGFKQTLTIIRAANSYIFGGYASVAWSQNEGNYSKNIFYVTNNKRLGGYLINPTNNKYVFGL